ncbi:VaFE repeat-containing surface-anchored protein [Blautia pseudococcoides]|uniref:VaFE repeat-containing surface-anchored protein n=1 Tax=Blautia pseudococcoides TaxID=1796616 RepID=UPI003517451B
MDWKNIAKRAGAFGMSLCVAATTLISGSSVVLAEGEPFVEYTGPSEYGGRMAGNFFMDGERAFCLEHSKLSPETGTPVEVNPYDNDMIKTVLYYGWDGKGNIFTDEAEGVVRTSSALSVLYSGDNENGQMLAQPLLDYAAEHLITDMNIYFSKESITASITGDQQKTEEVTVNGDARNTVSFSLPEQVVLHNKTTGEEAGGEVTVKGGDVFYLTAPLNGAADFSTGILKGSMGYCQPLLLKTADDSVQDLIKLWWRDPEHTTSLSVTWQKAGNIKVSKIDSESGKAVAGAEYTIYDAAGKKVGTITTDKKGEGILENLPAGDYTVKETKVPAGYFIDGTTYPVKVTPGETAAVGSKDQPVYGRISIQKSDKETGKAESQSSDKGFAGAEYTVYAAEKNRDYEKDQEAAVLTLNEDGKAVSGDLIHGKYYVKETKAPAGYLLDGNKYPVTLSDTAKEIKVYPVESADQVIRGDIELIKAEDGTLDRMANVKFSITNKLTGESHVFITDENGYYSTAAEWNKHTQNTNKGESPEDGIWFGGSEPDDGKGALPYGVYTIEELRCEANAGHKLVKFDVSIKRDNYTVNLGTVTNDLEKQIEIGTTAKDGQTGTNEGIPAKQVTIIDTVSYYNLIPGKEYTVKGTLMDQETKKELQVDGKAVKAEKTFTAEKADGSVDITFTFDGSALAGKKVVVFEKLFFEGREVAAHEDIEDKGQTVTYQSIKIGTTAKDKDTESSQGIPVKDVTIMDTVSYSNLIPGKEYAIKGTLMDKETKKELQINGKTVTAEKTFTAEKADGSVELEFTFDGSALGGKEIVVFEKLLFEGREVAAHEDIEDKGQTVTYQSIKIGTTAKDKATGKKEAAADKKITIVDTVAYKNLIPGKEYTVKGTLMDKETKKELQINGKTVTAEKTFTAEKADGSVELEFTFDGSALGGKKIVVFEKLYFQGREAAAHEDLKDEAQTVKITKLPVQKDTEQPQKTDTTATAPVKTGDTTSVFPYAAAGAAALAGVIGVLVWKKKRSA